MLGSGLSLPPIPGKGGGGGKLLGGVGIIRVKLCSSWYLGRCNMGGISLDSLALAEVKLMDKANPAQLELGG